MKEVEIAISGKPGKWGSESIGIEDNSLKIRLYNQCQRDSTVESRLAISCELIDGQPYTYYHYLKPKDVAQKRTENDVAMGRKHGREGSYFALTIRIKGKLINDIRYAYSLLEEMFNKHIVNHILSNIDSDGFWEYQILELSEAEQCLATIRNEVVHKLESNPKLLAGLSLLSTYSLSGNILKMNFEQIAKNEHPYSIVMIGDELYISDEYDGSKDEKTENAIPVEPDTSNVNEGVSQQSSIVYIDNFSNDQDEDWQSEDETEMEYTHNVHTDRDKRKNVYKFVAAIALLAIIAVPLYQMLKPVQPTDEVDDEEIAEVIDTDTENTTDTEAVVTEVKKEPEPYAITNLDIKDASKFTKGEVFKLTAVSKVNQRLHTAKGFGTFEIEPKGIPSYQDSAVLAIYIPLNFVGDTIRITYQYRYEATDTLFKRAVPVNPAQAK